MQDVANPPLMLVVPLKDVKMEDDEIHDFCLYDMET